MMLIPLILISCLTSKAIIKEDIGSRNLQVSNAEWKLTWSDDFDYSGLPDPKKWTYEEGLVRNNEAQYYASHRLQNSEVKNGELTITANKEEYKGSHYTSASITTQDRFAFQYGRAEIYAKLPQARGTWPAFWMLGTDVNQVSWPACGEVDVMEHVGFMPPTIYGTGHMQGADHKLHSQGGTTSLADNGSGWHLYAIEWSKTKIDFFVDSTKYFTYANNENNWTFDHPFYLILNLAIGGSWGGQKGIDDVAFPQKFVIKYVRVYKRI